MFHKFMKVVDCTAQEKGQKFPTPPFSLQDNPVVDGSKATLPLPGSVLSG